MRAGESAEPANQEAVMQNHRVPRASSSAVGQSETLSCFSLFCPQRLSSCTSTCRRVTSGWAGRESRNQPDDAAAAAAAGGTRSRYQPTVASPKRPLATGDGGEMASADWRERTGRNGMASAESALRKSRANQRSFMRQASYKKKRKFRASPPPG